MPEPLIAGAVIPGEPRPPAGAEARADRVLELYAATLARSLNERNAFNAAVHLYREQSPDLPEDDARRAVANIICRKT
jgi:hypothetical protein